MEKISSFIESHQDRFLEELKEIIRIPSVSTKSEMKSEVKKCAHALETMLKKDGFDEVEVIETGGHPIVYAQWVQDDSLPTVLVYGHYDVQPEEPVNEWNSPPFEPTVKDGALYARGAADDKGQFFIHLKSAEAFLKEHGKLPINLKILIEGEEEIGSPHLEPFIKNNKDKLACDVVMVSDTAMVDRGVPSITFALRGLTYLQIDVQGPNQDLHSGVFGGTVTNPATVLTEIVGQLKDDKGKVAIPGFYDDVVEPSSELRAMQAKVPFDETDFKESLGVNGLTGEVGFTPVERKSIRPTLDVCGLLSGFTGEGAKTIIPAKAMAKVSMRLVANQDPNKIFDLAKKHIESLAPAGVKVTVTDLHGGEPHMEDVEGPAMQAATAALEKSFGKAPIFTAEGGSIPIVKDFSNILGAKCVLMGIGTPDENIHGPNEKLYLDQFYKGILASAWFYQECATALKK